MNSVRVLQSNPHSATVQVYNAQVIVKLLAERFYQVECNLSTAIGLVPCRANHASQEHLCWHMCRAIEQVLYSQNPSWRVLRWFDRRSDALWMWAGNSDPMSLVRVESKTGQRGWAVVEGMLSGMEKAAMDVMQSKGAMK